jgi:hypothetical protein
MPTKLLYRCEPCNFEHEHLSFGTRWDKEVPPCPICGKELIHEEPESVEDYNYQCWVSDGGCGIKFSVEHLRGAAPDTYDCPMCGKVAKKQFQGFSIVHGKSMDKGSSVDVVIGRSAEERWGRLHERKAVRDKIRKDAGTQALKATGRDEYTPLKGGHLEAVSVPESTINKDE